MGCVMWYHCKVIVLVFGKVMGMRVFGWFWVMVSFYGIFYAMTGLECTWLCSLTLWKRGAWPTIEAAKDCVLVLVRGCLGRVGCVLDGCWAVWRRCVFRACEGLLLWVGYGMECAEWVEKTWFAVRMLEWGCSAAICLGRSRVRGSMLVCGCRRVFCQPWRWQIVELPIVSRRHLDRYSLLFRSFFACSSFGPR